MLIVVSLFHKQRVPDSFKGTSNKKERKKEHRFKKRRKIAASNE